MSPPSSNLYARNFWSPEGDASVSVLWDHFRDGTKDIECILQFYKERLSIEQEYSKRLANLARKSPLTTRDTGDTTLSDSIHALLDETKHLAGSHAEQAQNIAESVYKPLVEFLSSLKARNKPWDSTISEFVRYKVAAKTKATQSAIKYEAHWSKINSLRTEMILVDDTEAGRLQRKLDKHAAAMILEREKCYKLVNQYNKIQQSFKKEWCHYCENSQSLEEERIKFIRRNIWEYANSISTSCISDDQSAENIRLSLEKCSYDKDIRDFVAAKKTGGMSGAPMKFVDFAKGETKPRAGTEKKSMPVDVDSLLASRRRDSKTSEKTERSLDSHATAKRAVKKAPPKPTQRQQATLDYIDRGAKTFEELERQAQEESERESLPAKTHPGDTSEPSSYKVMSDYSGTTPSTSVFSDKNPLAKVVEPPKLKESIISNPLLHSVASTVSDSSSNSPNRKRKNIDANEVLRNSPDPLKAYLSDLSLGGNGNMNRVKEKIKSASRPISRNNSDPRTERKRKAHSLGSLLENMTRKGGAVQFDDGDSDSDTSSKILSRIPSSVSMSQRTTSRRVSSSTRRAKSQENLRNKFITENSLPSHSSEGFKVKKYCRAQFSYKAEIDQELTFKKRDILLILHQQPDGWWFAENANSGDSGLAPSNYLVDL